MRVHFLSDLTKKDVGIVFVAVIYCGAKKEVQKRVNQDGKHSSKSVFPFFSFKKKM